MRNRDSSVPEKWRNQQGLSLLETLIVALMIGIVVAIALPVASRAISAYKTSIAANHIAERLSGARSLAMSENTSISFSFNASSGQYGYDFTAPSPGVPPDGIPDTSDPAHPDQSYYVESMPSGTSISFPGNSNIIITFNSRGELPIGTVITDPSGLGLKVGVVGTYGTASVWVNLRGKVWVTTP